ASPYLRIAARDDHDEVRTAAAACLADVAAADPKGAARMAAELTESEQPAVRIAAAQAIGEVAGPAAELVFPSLLKLVGDPTREVRAAAERAFTRLAGSPQAAVVRRRAADAERALEGALVQGDVAERQTIVAAAVKAELWGLLKQAAREGATSPRVEIVRAAVDDRSEAVRAEAMRLLAGAAGGGARDVLPTFEA